MRFKRGDNCGAGSDSSCNVGIMRDETRAAVKYSILTSDADYVPGVPSYPAAPLNSAVNNIVLNGGGWHWHKDSPEHAVIYRPVWRLRVAWARVPIARICPAIANHGSAPQADSSSSGRHAVHGGRRDVRGGPQDLAEDG